MVVHKGQIKLGKEVSTEEKICFLQQPQNYSFHVEEIVVKETHMSVVFLTKGFVYKMKKPVQYDLFDHRSLNSRFINCKEELKINRPLAKNVYIGLVPLVLNEKKQLQLGGEGEVVEWLVKMKRIPEESMLDFAIINKCIDQECLEKAADLLAEFYKASAAIEISLNKQIRKLEGDISLIGERLKNPLFDLPSELIKEITLGLTAFLAASESLFAERIRRNKIIDAHGDLRPEHICLIHTPAIIDRLEFNKDLRIMDVAEELSFLSMECETIGNSSAGEFFTEEYQRKTGDYFPPTLSRFYKIKKACLRSYLVARHVLEPQYKDDAKWLSKASAYLDIAKKHYQQLPD